MLLVGDQVKSAYYLKGSDGLIDDKGFPDLIRWLCPVFHVPDLPFFSFSGLVIYKHPWLSLTDMMGEEQPFHGRETKGNTNV